MPSVRPDRSSGDHHGEDDNSTDAEAQWENLRARHTE